MSLSKSFQLCCDISELLMDRVMATTESAQSYGPDLEATQDQRHAAKRGCANFSPIEWDARRARSSAKSAGWTRRTEQRPIYVGTTETTTVRYDLCPSCSKVAEQPGLPAVPVPAHP